MKSVAVRLFLIFLLGVDWAADPTQLALAVRMLARSRASTECFCHSLTYRREALRRAAPADVQPDHAARTPRASWRATLAAAARWVPHPYLGATSLVYQFMSIRR